MDNLKPFCWNLSPLLIALPSADLRRVYAFLFGSTLLYVYSTHKRHIVSTKTILFVTVICLANLFGKQDECWVYLCTFQWGQRHCLGLRYSMTSYILSIQLLDPGILFPLRCPSICNPSGFRLTACEHESK